MKPRHWLVVIGAILCGLALAQSRVPTIQMRGPRVTTPEILAAMPDGQVVSAKLGPGLAINVSGGIVTISAPPPPRPQWFTSVLTAQADGTYLAPDGAQNLVLFRNGLRQTIGQDYRIDGRVITIFSGAVLIFSVPDNQNAAELPQGDIPDLVVIDYWK